MTHPANYWTYERCKEAALKYKTRTEFKNNSSSAYSIAWKNSWLNEVCIHMVSKYKLYKPKNFWTKEKCKEEAKKYKTKNEFKTSNCPAYNSAKRHNWLKDICQHMPRRAQRRRAAWAKTGYS